MDNVQIFKNEEVGVIRGLEINNEPYVVGIDIAKALGYENGSRDINRHTEEEDRAVVPIRYFRSK